MKEHITPERIANSIMQDSSFSGYYLIVEGNKDYKLYSKFFNNNVVIKEAWGCEKVKKVLKILEDREFDRKLGIIDADFSNILKVNHNIKDLFQTDYHDIEVMMIKSNALNSILNFYCKKKYIDDFRKTKNNYVFEVLMDLGKEIGLLKLANIMYDLGLIFKPKNPEGKQIKYKQFISEADLSFLGNDKLIETIFNYSINKSGEVSSKDEIYEKLKKVSTNHYELEQLVNGHDLTNILYILIKKVLKSRSNMLKDFNCIEDSLILSYESGYFVKTKLCSNILEWSKLKNVSIMDDNIENMSLQGECLNTAN